jgi:hypothetical protein
VKLSINVGNTSTGSNVTQFEANSLLVDGGVFTSEGPIQFTVSTISISSGGLLVGLHNPYNQVIIYKTD